ncbi:MAG: cytidylate kinase-like family protein [Candidatus Borkfalkiaceae bacterium]|nr:cytidylate kinase-like family protein [Clostridia bacterium]MDY6222774.1 cytidylate kinase-like family protein [Christensenellaceae bacterium]
MKKNITVGREFGSGGREIGKRLAEELGVNYYDKEIITRVAEKSDFSEGFVEKIIEDGAMQRNFLSFGHSFSEYRCATTGITEKILRAQKEVIESLAETDCVIVGRCADLILSEKRPFRLFVYADEQSKVKRCRLYAEGEEKNLSDKQLLKKIRAIDKGRKKLYGLFYGKEWGNRENYDLCVNTSNADISSLAPCVAEYVRRWYENK